jgi:preprotein translocase SecE subunit
VLAKSLDVVMPSVKDKYAKDPKPMATNAIVPASDEPGDEKPTRQPPPAPRGPSRPGFFTIYKRGQGKWTRLGTIFAAALMGLLTAFFLGSDYLPPIIHNHRVMYGIIAGFLVVYSLLVFWLSNKPRNVDFLIATDSEMKKVNWTTQGELYGSTRVVILFIIFVAIFLFTFDIVFAELFHLISVLRTGPF